jgi:hypothetical protein
MSSEVNRRKKWIFTACVSIQYNLNASKARLQSQAIVLFANVACRPN